MTPKTETTIKTAVALGILAAGIAAAVTDVVIAGAGALTTGGVSFAVGAGCMILGAALYLGALAAERYYGKSSDNIETIKSIGVAIGGIGALLTAATTVVAGAGPAMGIGETTMAAIFGKTTAASVAGAGEAIGIAAGIGFMAGIIPPTVYNFIKDKFSGSSQTKEAATTPPTQTQQANIVGNQPSKTAKQNQQPRAAKGKKQKGKSDEELFNALIEEIERIHKGKKVEELMTYTCEEQNKDNRKKILQYICDTEEAGLQPQDILHVEQDNSTITDKNGKPYINENGKPYTIDAGDYIINENGEIYPIVSKPNETIDNSSIKNIIKMNKNPLNFTIDVNNDPVVQPAPPETPKTPARQTQNPNPQLTKTQTIHIKI